MGFDDIEISRFLKFLPLTTGLSPYREIGAQAVELLVNLVQSGDAKKPAEKNVILTPTLRIRGSTAPLKKGGVGGSAINSRVPQRSKPVSTANTKIKPANHEGQ